MWRLASLRLRALTAGRKRLSTGCRLKVSNFQHDGEKATIRVQEKGDKRKTIGSHFAAAQAIQEYIDKGQKLTMPTLVTYDRLVDDDQRRKEGHPPVH